MCDQTEIVYKEGDIVWVKLGSCWWPGEVKDLENVPKDVIYDFKKPPLAVVKFFQEDTYEYVRNINNIYSYNCNKKYEFIKKGLVAYRGKNLHMEKFPSDVCTAETKTGGDPNILSDSYFTPEKKPNYTALIFGSPSPKKSSKDGGRSKGRPSLNKSSATKKTPTICDVQVTHPRFLGKDDHEVRILVQTPQESQQEDTQSYSCPTCGFQTSRIEVIVLHNKSHIQGVYTPISTTKKGKRSPGKKPKRTTKMSHSKTSTIDEDLALLEKGLPLTTDSSEEEEITDAPKPKRKSKSTTLKQKQKSTIKKKEPEVKMDIRKDLLAEWEDDSDAELEFNVSTAETTKSSEQPAEESKEVKETDKSCFDFEDEEDSEVAAATGGRKIPRVLPSAEKRKSTESQNVEAEEKEEPSKVESEKTEINEEKTNENATNDDLNLDAFKSVLDETSVPKLPEIPTTLKCEQNFHNANTIKFPDKNEPVESINKNTKEESSKLINPKKRFVKSFEDFEQSLNEQRKIELEKQKADEKSAVESEKTIADKEVIETTTIDQQKIEESKPVPVEDQQPEEEEKKESASTSDSDLDAVKAEKVLAKEDMTQQLEVSKLKTRLMSKLTSPKQMESPVKIPTRSLRGRPRKSSDSLVDHLDLLEKENEAGSSEKIKKTEKSDVVKNAEPTTSTAAQEKPSRRGRKPAKVEEVEKSSIVNEESNSDSLKTNKKQTKTDENVENNSSEEVGISTLRRSRRSMKIEEVVTKVVADESEEKREESISSPDIGAIEENLPSTSRRSRRGIKKEEGAKIETVDNQEQKDDNVKSPETSQVEEKAHGSTRRSRKGTKTEETKSESVENTEQCEESAKNLESSVVEGKSLSPPRRSKRGMKLEEIPLPPVKSPDISVNKEVTGKKRGRKPKGEGSDKVHEEQENSSIEEIKEKSPVPSSSKTPAKEKSPIPSSSKTLAKDEIEVIPLKKNKRKSDTFEENSASSNKNNLIEEKEQYTTKKRRRSSRLDKSEPAQVEENKEEVINIEQSSNEEKLDMELESNEEKKVCDDSSDKQTTDSSVQEVLEKESEKTEITTKEEINRVEDETTRKQTETVKEEKIDAETKNIDEPCENSKNTSGSKEDNMEIEVVSEDEMKTVNQIKNNVFSNFTENEEMSALTTLATVSEMSTGLNTDVVKEEHVVPIDGNLTVVTEQDLADKQVEIATSVINDSETTKPITLASFSLDFSDSCAESSNSIDETLTKKIEKKEDTSTKVDDNKIESLVKANKITNEDLSNCDIEEQIPSLVVRGTGTIESEMAKITNTVLESGETVKQKPEPSSSSFKLLEILTDTKPKSSNSTSSVTHKSHNTIKLKSDELKLLKKLPVPKQSTSQLDNGKNSKFVIKPTVYKTAQPTTKSNKPIIISEKIIKPLTESESVSVQKVTSKRTYQDVEDIDTFIIQKPAKKIAVSEDESFVIHKSEDDKVLSGKQFSRKTVGVTKTAGKARILQQTIITPAGDVIQPAVSSQNDDNMFDINSMPIVLSDQILTPESIENMPIMLSDSVQTTGKSTNLTVPAKKVQSQQVKLLNKTPSILLKDTHKTSVVKSYTPQKTTKTQKVYQTSGTKLKHSPTIITQTGKPGKFIIVPSGTTQTGRYTVGKRTQAVKKSNVLLPTTTTATSKVQNIAPEPTGNKIMIVTNQQGQQQRVLLTPAQQKMLGYQTPTKITKGTIKGNVIQKSVLSKTNVPTSTHTAIIQQTIINSKPQTVTTQNLVTSSGQVLTPLTSQQMKTIKIDPKTGRKIQNQRVYVPTTIAKTGTTQPQQRTIIIKNQHGQTLKKLQSTDDALLDQQVQEQIEAIKASEKYFRAKTQVTSFNPRVSKSPIRRYIKKTPVVTTKSQTLLNISAANSMQKTEQVVPPLAPISPTKKVETVPKQQQEIKMDVDTQQLLQVEDKKPRPLNQLVIQDAVGNQTTITEGQILALPSETIDGQPQSYMLVTLDESGNLTPLNNEALMSLDPNLGLGGDLSNMVLQIDQGSNNAQESKTEEPVKTQQERSSELTQVIGDESNLLLQKAIQEQALDNTELTQNTLSGTTDESADSSQQNLDPNAMQTVTCSINSDAGQQLLVTGDVISTQKFLESLTEGNSDLANILANAEGSILIQADGQQILINAEPDNNQVLLSLNSDNLNVLESTEGGGNPIFSTQPSKNQDILAAALADTDVFQQEQNGPASQSKVTQSQLSPSSTSLYPMNVGNVLETSLTLSSPIMTPLEVPSINNKKIADDETDILTQVPKNVDLPITITDPNIAQTVAHQHVSSLMTSDLSAGLELPLSISADTSISVSSTEMNSPSFVYSLPSLDDTVDLNQKAFSSSISMPLLTEEPEENLESGNVLEETETTKEKSAEDTFTESPATSTENSAAPTESSLTTESSLAATESPLAPTESPITPLESPATTESPAAPVESPTSVESPSVSVENNATSADDTATSTKVSVTSAEVTVASTSTTSSVVDPVMSTDASASISVDTSVTPMDIIPTTSSMSGDLESPTTDSGFGISTTILPESIDISSKLQTTKITDVEPYMEEEGLCTLGGEMCSSLSEPPPDMFDVENPTYMAGELKENNAFIKDSTDIPDHRADIIAQESNTASGSLENDDDTQIEHPDLERDHNFESYESNEATLFNVSTNSGLDSPSLNTDENSCEIPVQPPIVTDLMSETFENFESNSNSNEQIKRGYDLDEDGEENDNKKCKFD